MLKNIVFVCDSSHVLGGIENVAFTAAKELASRHYNVYLFASIGPINKDLMEAGIHIMCLEQYDILSNPNRFSAIRQGIFNNKAYLRLKEMLKGLNPEETIIHVHGWTKALSSSIFLAIANTGFKVVVTIHDYFSVCPNGGFYNYQQNKICNKKPLSLNCICCNCDSRSYPIKLFRVIRSFVQRRNMFRNRQLYFIYISQITHDAVLPYLEKHIKGAFYLRNPAKIQNNLPVDISCNDTYLFIARLSPEKGAKLFCQAITDLGLKGCVLGDGYLKDELIAAYPNIEFVGWVDGNRKDAIIRKGKGLVFPSLWYEGSPLTILEMMSYGIPCIVPDRCAASEEIKDGITGYVFKTGDLASLKEAILRYERTDLREMQYNILSSFNASECSSNVHVTNLIKIYNQILSEA